MRTKRVTLWRLLPFPGFKRVTVAPITVRGFREAMRIGLARLLEFAAECDGKPTAEQAETALGDPATVAGLADLICRQERPGFFRRWHSHANVVRLMGASWEVENDPGWKRILGLIDLTGERVKRGGGLVCDIAAICRLYSLSPPQVLEWTMQDFLDTADCVTTSARAAEEAELLDDPTMDPEAKPTPLTNVPPGRGKVWVN